MTKVMTTPTIVRIHALVRNLPAPTEVMRQRIHGSHGVPVSASTIW